MVRVKGKTRSNKNTSAKGKGRASGTTLIETNSDIHVGDTRLSGNVLTRVSDKLGIPVDQVSQMVETIRKVAQDVGDTDRVINEHNGDEAALIQILLEIQRENRWLPRNVLVSVCEKLGVPLSRAYRIATFYKAFSLIPQGRHSASVCMGTACHVRGAPRLLDRVIDTIDIRPGETSSDQKFTLETVNCLGCCALGPVMVIDGEYHSNPSPKEIARIANACD